MFISKASRNEYIVDTLNSIQTEIDEARVNFHTLEQGMMLLSSEEEIKGWEDWFNLPFKQNFTLQDRIDRVIYTFNSRGFFTETFLKQQADVFTNGQIDVVQDYPNYHFDVQFTSAIGAPANLDNFKEMVDINKPAHLTWEMFLRFRTHDELKPFTHNFLGGYTHEELRSRAIITNKKKEVK